MLKNQAHGKVFEAEVLQAMGMKNKPEPTAIFDGNFFKKEPNNLVSIKTTRKGLSDTAATVVHFGDACRIWTWHAITSTLAFATPKLVPNVQVLVGVYQQDKDFKNVEEIHSLTFDLTKKKTRQALYGTLTLEEVQAFHMGLRKEFHQSYKKARSWAKKLKANFSKKSGVLQLNPKVDSGTQRRLQCSAHLQDLIRIADKHEVYSESFNTMELPFKVKSRKRIRKQRVSK